MLLLIGALPLLVYPFVLMANIMSLAAEGATDAEGTVAFAAKCFFWLSTIYPAVYLPCCLLTFANRMSQEPRWRA